MNALRFTRTSASIGALGALLLLLAAGSVHVLEAQHEQYVSNGAELGRVDFQVSCAPTVQEDFDRAVALLHHMMYQEARSLFEAIAEEDPDCAMAPWGVATTLFQPLWPARPDAEARRRGWEAVQRARSLGPETERERLLLDATEAFFQNPDAEEWWPRIDRWAAAMETAYRARPDDLEIGAFYGLSILAAGQTAEDQLAQNERAAEVLEEVHEREPLHPGAIHYTIHADDARGRASEHLEVVGSYGEIAPSVPHALHMPSHVYVRLGEWPRVIEWNERSAEAALESPAGDRTSIHHAHALDYLLYAHLQRGNDAAAAVILEDRIASRPYQEDFTAAFHLAVMPARFALERRAWDEAAELTPETPEYLAWERYDWPRALSWFAIGMGAAHTDDLPRAREAEARLEELRASAEAAGEQRFATYIEIDRLILEGRIAGVEGDEQRAVDRTRAAAELEATVEKHPVSPGALLPPYEALGDLLLELGRTEEALEAYEASLEVWPGRYHSLLGAARAARESGDMQTARTHYAALLEVVGDAPSGREGVREAAEAVGALR